MNHLFSVHSDYEPPTGSAVLLLELGERFCSVAFIERENKQLYSFDHYCTEDKNENIISFVLQNHPQVKSGGFPVAASFYSAGSIFVPKAVCEEGNIPEALTFFMKEKNNSASDHLSHMGLYNVYSIPRSIINEVNAIAESGNRWHFFSVRLKNIFLSGTDIFYIDFRAQEFSVVYFSRTGLQLCQVYDYNSARDVLYYLLKICSSFDLDRKNLGLSLSGFVEKNSQLYDELNKYFTGIRFESLPAGITTGRAFENYPDYYFTSVCNLAQCVL